ncbi:hypothetical protein QJS04_geneDACA024973 [Acorus gramineus]|uniref:Uncharacterized protein n=1 Tax=Acorus gramineus TaxID=55184 RepID=A0AAV9A0H7_ACOGR|nr:hypothetical protein QJS04_geneDACA024973 [Acorus gramineus]
MKTSTTEVVLGKCPWFRDKPPTLSQTHQYNPHKTSTTTSKKPEMKHLMVLVMVLVGLVVGPGVESQTLCNMSMGELVACRPYVSRPPARGKPASLCCSGLK